jgi:hypothetical protein
VAVIRRDNQMLLNPERCVRPPYGLMCKVRIAFYVPSAPTTDGEDGLPGRMVRGEARDAVRRSQGRRSIAAVAH